MTSCCLSSSLETYAYDTPADSLYRRLQHYNYAGDEQDAAAVRQAIYALAKHDNSKLDSIDYLEFLLKARAGQALAMKNKLQQEKIQEKVQEKKNTQLLTAGLIIVAVLLLALLLSRYYNFRLARRQEKELAKGYAAISEKNAELKATDEFKNKLISIIANDFREPLLHITTVAAELRSGEMSKDEMLASMRQIGASSQKTLEVFDNVLRWIKLQLSGYEYSPVSCWLQEQVQAAMIGLEASVSEHHLSVVDRIPDEMVIEADMEILQFILRHMLLAAVRHSVPDSLLILDAWPDEEQVRTSLAIDAGANAVDVSEGIFAWQRDTYALGMAVSRDFAIRMGGDIVVEVSADRYLTISLILKQGRGTIVPLIS
ncbi:sensor histidine kinase [Chitinophaga sp. Hz27]|uniref:sensor histidine kinase n=1 Tax=Chitinophaga sp. Hz27 TaxID=3347169 RepID=UPI0035DBBB2B